MELTEKAQQLIAAGLAVLIFGSIWPPLPCVMGVGLIGYGATLYTRERSDPGGIGSLVCAMQFTVYAFLVMLFAGARLHLAAVGKMPLRIVDGIDFFGAAILIVLAGIVTYRSPHGHQA